MLTGDLYLHTYAVMSRNIKHLNLF